MRRKVSGFSWILIMGALVMAGCSGKPEQQAVASGTHDAGVRLTPDPANVKSQLTVVLDAQHGDPASCQYVWSRNGAAISGATTGVLSPDQFRKGDRIRVDVSVPGSGGKSATTLTSEVSVADSPPVVLAAQLVLSASSSGTVLHARPECTDPDGDPATYTYRWYRNGNMIAEAADSNLVITSFARSDRVAVEVVASSGAAASEPRRSEEFVLENRPPQFSSQPVALAAGEQAFRYQAVATDPDGDALRYELVQGPTGMTMAASGAVEWTMPAQAAGVGDFVVKLRAVDSKGGEAMQDFTIRVAAPSTKRQ